ncbi:hypothetical protein ACIPSE_05325 [Streptomyces sp. NPDC090106]|uniref:hypothetical protein n=1 Tax=Streptomyces sp. NPDC090106 TaxID=3365946 RepID=UPI0037F38EDF
MAVDKRLARRHEETPSGPPRYPGPENGPREVTAVTGAVRALRDVAPRVRLAARRDPLIAACVSGELLRRSLDVLTEVCADAGPGASCHARYTDVLVSFARARNFTARPPTAPPGAAQVLELANVLTRAVAHDLDEAALGHDLAAELVVVLDEAARARDPARVLSLAPVAAVLAADLAREAADRLGLPSADGLADAVLDGALDDFTDADLTDVDPADFRLTGIHWTEDGTRWPPGTDLDALRRRSRETTPHSGVRVLGRRRSVRDARGS